MGRKQYKPRWEPGDGFLTITATANRLGIGSGLVKRWLRQGRLIGERFNGSNKWFVTIVSIEAIEAERQQQKQAAVARSGRNG